MPLVLKAGIYGFFTCSTIPTQNWSSWNRVRMDDTLICMPVVASGLHVMTLSDSLKDAR